MLYLKGMSHEATDLPAFWLLRYMPQDPEEP